MGLMKIRTTPWIRSQMVPSAPEAGWQRLRTQVRTRRAHKRRGDGPTDDTPGHSEGQAAPPHRRAHGRGGGRAKSHAGGRGGFEAQFEEQEDFRDLHQTCGKGDFQFALTCIPYDFLLAVLMSLACIQNWKWLDVFHEKKVFSQRRIYRSASHLQRRMVRCGKDCVSENDGRKGDIT